MRTLVDLGSFGEYLHYGMPLNLVTVLGPDGRVNVATNASITPLPGETPRLVIAVLKDNLTNTLIAQQREFVVNVLTQDMRAVARQCGTRSGSDVDKLALCGLTTLPARFVKTPLVAECPLNFECQVEANQSLDDVDLWISRILAMEVAPAWSDGRASVDLQKFQPLLYAFGQTFERGPQIGFGSF